MAPGVPVATFDASCLFIEARAQFLMFFTVSLFSVVACVRGYRLSQVGFFPFPGKLLLQENVILTTIIGEWIFCRVPHKL